MIDTSNGDNAALIRSVESLFRPAEGDIVQRLRDTPNWRKESFGSWKDCVSTYDRAPFEAADEIERLRALATQPPQDERGQELKWCPGCGEGVTNFCRGNSDLCKMFPAEPAQPVAHGEPIGWLKPNESFAPDAFRWARTDTHIRPLFFANEPSTPPQPLAAEVAIAPKLLLERAAEMCEWYAEFIRENVMSVDIERHPYLPELEGIAADLFALAGTGSDESGEGEA